MGGIHIYSTRSKLERKQYTYGFRLRAGFREQATDQVRGQISDEEVNRSMRV